ncbi:hypothetical protein CYMTET_55192 [Cymbomonas tetramitiformis]|uniref:Uncharacterized protein n=1 Tax=Cymbomonas tetramitiformis TaxID=36881 RepID=A0AAE0BFE6_9CHLO|nr:hypothetical protein CYMTET_55192 [Cymbomonas tetramitiformis]
MAEIVPKEAPELTEDTTEPVEDISELVEDTTEPVKDISELVEDARPPSKRPSYGGILRHAKNTTVGANTIFDAAMLIYEKTPEKSFKSWMMARDKNVVGYTNTTEFKLQAWSDRYQLTNCVYDRQMCIYIVEKRIWKDFFFDYCKEKKLHWDHFRAEFKCGNGFFASLLCKTLKQCFVVHGLVAPDDACARHSDLE